MYNFILSLFFPPLCVGCRKFGTVLCDTCRKTIYGISRTVCSVCEKESEYGETHEQCKSDALLDGVFHLYQYKGVIRNVVRQAKYHDNVQAYRLLCEEKKEFIQRYIKHYAHEDICIVPIPLHSKRLRTRGFNQAEVIARVIQKTCNIPYENTLTRVRDTQSQVTMKTKEERQQNMAEAFSLALRHTSYQTYILIDDLYTTGSTIREAAKTIKKHNNFCKIIACTFAHG